MSNTVVIDNIWLYLLETEVSVIYDIWWRLTQEPRRLRIDLGTIDAWVISGYFKRL